MNYLLLLLGFFCGSIPFGFLLGKAQGIDVREVGSGNIGATNVWRSCGWKAGLAALLLDILKGFAPTMLAARLAPELTGLHVGAGACAVLGHTFSPWLGFKGGKGVATAAGVVFALEPLGAAIGVATFLSTVALTRYVSLGSLLGALAIGLAVQVQPTPVVYKAVVWGAVTLIWIRHRANLKRLLNGEESKFQIRGGNAPQGAPAEEASEA